MTIGRGGTVTVGRAVSAGPAAAAILIALLAVVRIVGAADPAGAAQTGGASLQAGGASLQTGGASPQSGSVRAFMTLYGYADNSPPGTGIAHPCIHPAAGGTGTYRDPITFATDVDEEPWCTIIYVPYMERYFIHEDECSQCDADWNTSHLYRFDMWAGGDALSRVQPERRALLRCESTWTRGNSPTDPANPAVLVDPPSNLPVTPDPIFSPPGTCWQPIGVADPGTQTTLLGTGPVSLQIRATDSNPGATLAYGSTGLPAGLALDAATGLITGAPTLRGRARVNVVASDGLDSAGVTFRWIVRPAPRR